MRYYELAYKTITVHKIDYKSYYISSNRADVEKFTANMNVSLINEKCMSLFDGFVIREFESEDCIYKDTEGLIRRLARHYKQ